MIYQKWFRRLSLSLVLLFVLAAVPAAFAADARTDDKVIIEAGETVNDDLYVAGETVQIDGTVNGDVIVGASTVIVNGTVNGDLMGGASEIIINGSVNDDIRAGGYAITVNGSVGGDLLGGGYGIHVADAGSVGGDVLAGGLNVAIDGSVGGDVQFGALGVRINGSVGGDVKGEVGSAEDAPPFDPSMFDPTAPDYVQVAPGLTVGPSASIGGNLEYDSPSAQDVPSDAVGGNVTFNEVVAETAEPVPMGRQIANRVWRAVQQWLILLLIGFLLMRFTPAVIERATAMINAEPLPAAGWGLLWFIAWPIMLSIGFALIILLAVILGFLTLDAIAGLVVGVGMLILGLELGAYILIITLLAKVVVAHLLGERLMSNGQAMVAFAVGALIVVALGAIPMVGGIVNFVVSLVGLGAVWLMWRNRNSDADAVIEKQPNAVIV